MKQTNKITLAFILLTATILRFINYPEIPFTHDEFSAIFRLDFGSFSEMIDNGVRIDGHPAGIQVFLWYWTKLFGFNEWVVKLPFTLMGILSVLLIYIIGGKWYNQTVGLIAAAYLATIQFTVIYSQIARPYISGLFFSLLLVNFLTNIIKNPKNQLLRNYCLLILSASLCAYNHYFSLLFAFIAGFSGLFMINKKYLKGYLISGLIVFLLYIPHLNIFIGHLRLEGVGAWLGQPDNRFFFRYIYYICNFSVVSVTIMLILAVSGLIYSNENNFTAKKLILFTVWFFLPIITGYLYSKYISAVLQFSVLIFSFPYLFFILFGHIRIQSPRINLLIVALILCTNIFSLTFGRRHFELFYNSPYEHIVSDFQKISNTNANIAAIIDSDRKITDYYLKRDKINNDFTWFDSFDGLNGLINFLEYQSIHNNKLYLGCISLNNPLTVPVIQDYFPSIAEQRNYAGGTTYLFSKDPQPVSNENVDILSFESEPSKSWSPLNEKYFCDSLSYSGSYSYHIDSLTEWSPSFSVDLNEIISNKYNFIDISIKVNCNINPKETLLVAALESNNNTIHWGATSFDIFYKKNNWFTTHHSIKLSDIRFKNPQLKVYIWNKGKNNLYIDDFIISVRKGNPVIYGLIEKI